MKLMIAVLALCLCVPVLGMAQEQHEKTETKTSVKQKQSHSGNKNTRTQKTTTKRSGNTTEQTRPQTISHQEYGAHFGEQHSFHVTVNDYQNRRFSYGGYNFGFVGEWPGYWQYTDDVYVCLLGDVYYLCNAEYPGVTVELAIQ